MHTLGTVLFIFLVITSGFIGGSMFGYAVGKANGESKKKYDVAGEIDIFQESDDGNYQVAISSNINFSMIPKGTRMIFVMGDIHSVE